MTNELTNTRLDRILTREIHRELRDDAKLELNGNPLLLARIVLPRDVLYLFHIDGEDNMLVVDPCYIPEAVRYPAHVLERGERDPAFEPKTVRELEAELGYKLYCPDEEAYFRGKRRPGW